MDGGSTRSTIDKPLAALIGEFASKEGVVRAHAREQIVSSFGKSATSALIEALASPSERVRWEAAKTLSEICDPASAPALVRALRDEDSDVRWIAAEGLIGLGADSLIPLLEELVMHSNSAWLRDGAHHVLHDLARRGILRSVLQPVIESLESVAPTFGVMPVAARALRQLEEAGYQ